MGLPRTIDKRKKLVDGCVCVPILKEISDSELAKLEYALPARILSHLHTRCLCLRGIRGSLLILNRQMTEDL